jgi:ABC-type polar amino acid transport system ATPase subunit
MIQVKGLHKSFGANHVLRGLDLEIQTSEALVVIGRSGCGKSILLKQAFSGTTNYWFFLSWPP